MVFQNYTVKAVYDNGQLATPKFYRDYLKTIKAKNIPYRTLRDGDRLDFGGGVLAIVVRSSAVKFADLAEEITLMMSFTLSPYKKP